MSFKKEATKVYPNPASHFINIELPEAKLISKCSVIDASGSYHLQRKFEEVLQNVQLNIAEIPNGLYSLVVEAENTLIVRMIVVQNE
ncbi:MAG: T9SS type A sorting domain-containing protein [Bacteroidota bacterium]